MCLKTYSNVGWGENKTTPQNVIKQANSANMVFVFKHFNLPLNEINTKSRCPFPFHQEKTASFKFYKNTNSFFCFGCKSGGGPVEFVSFIKNISKIDAATEIVSNFETDSEVVALNEENSSFGKHQLFLDFSSLIRCFIIENLDDGHALEYAEKVSLIFDVVNFRHELDTIGLKSLIQKLKIKLEQYNVDSNIR